MGSFDINLGLFPAKKKVHMEKHLLSASGKMSFNPLVKKLKFTRFLWLISF